MINIRNITYLVLGMLLATACAVPRISTRPFKVIEKEALPEFRRGLWIRATSTASPDSISRIVRVVNDMDVTDVFVQVVVGGYAYYKSKLLPRSQYLSRISGADYDPLDSLIRAFEGTSVRIHAWMNTLLTWSLSEPPDSLRHIFYTNPDWFIRDVNNQSMADYSYYKWKDLRLEGLYLDPTDPEVRVFLIKICHEIAARYPVEGIHLDFIRYPGIIWGLPNNDEAAVLAGTDADIALWCDLVNYGRMNVFERWLIWHAWRLTRNRQWAISQIVTDLGNVIEQYAMNKDCRLSTAVFANPALFRYSFAQNWPNWQGDLYFPVIMSYTPNITLFSDYLNFAVTHRPDALIGIGFLWPGMMNTALWQEKAVREMNGTGVCYFDFTRVDTISDISAWKQSVPSEDSLITDSTRYETVADVFIERPQPTQVEQGSHMVKWGEDLRFAAFLLSLSMNPTRDLARMGLSRTEFVNLISEDVAAFNFLDDALFPLGNELVEPPTRRVRFTFLPWSTGDSLAVIARAHETHDFVDQALLYPAACDPFTKAVFAAQQSNRDMLLTPSGIYVFMVDSIDDGGRIISRNTVLPGLLPVFTNWTIKKMVTQLIGTVD